MDFFEHCTSEQRAQIDNLRALARKRAALEEAAAMAAETQRRIEALPFWPRKRAEWASRWWSSVAWILYRLRGWLPALHASRVATQHFLQPSCVWPELRTVSRHQRHEPGADVGSAATVRAAAYRALAEEMATLPTNDGGNLSIETTLQVEEVARLVESGVDEGLVREAMKRIREGEPLVETLKRGLAV